MNQLGLFKNTYQKIGGDDNREMFPYFQNGGKIQTDMKSINSEETLNTPMWTDVENVDGRQGHVFKFSPSTSLPKFRIHCDHRPGSPLRAIIRRDTYFIVTEKIVKAESETTTAESEGSITWWKITYKGFSGWAAIPDDEVEKGTFRQVHSLRR